MEPGGPVRVQLLGGFRVELPDGRVAGPWSRPSARRLFQIVVLRDRRRVGREEVAELLFSDLAPARAANAVSKALTMARTALAPFPILQADRDVIWLEGRVQVDADVARETLRQALSQAPGDVRDATLVAGLAARGRMLDDDMYADWATAGRSDLEALQAYALLTLASDRSAGHGRASDFSTMEAWSDVLALDWTNEEACSALMGTCARAGQRDLVVRNFHRTVAALHRLELAPSASLRAAYAEAVSAAGTVRPAASPAASSRDSFGRDVTFGGLLDAVTATSRGSGQAVFVTGPAGIGKSHALDVLREGLQTAGWQVVHAGGAPDDGRAPLRALRVLLAQLELDEADGLVDRLADRSAPWAGADVHDLRAHLLEQLRVAFDAQAERRPFVVMFDDVQWMDRGLQGILSGLLTSGTDRRWAIVLAARSGDAGLSVVLPPGVRQLDLVRLAADATELLVRHTSPLLSEAAVLRAVHRSGGNPLFAIELARQVAAADPAAPLDDEGVPDVIIELLRARLAVCSPAARQVMSLVALLDEDAAVDVLLSLGTRIEIEPDMTIGAIDELLVAHLLDERTAGVRVVHPLLRDATVATLNPTRRADLHALIAEELDGEGAARHRIAAFESCGLGEHAAAAADAGFRAGGHARNLSSEDAALLLLTSGLKAFEAVATFDRGDLRAGAVQAWLQVGEIHQDQDRRAEAGEAFDAALALAACDEEKARVWSAKGSLAYRAGDFASAVAAYESGIKALLDPAPVLRARLEADLGWVYSRLGRHDEAIRALEQAAMVLTDCGERLTAGHALDQLATVLGAAGRPEEGLETMRRAFEIMGPTGDEKALGILHVHRAALYGVVQRFGEALADIAAGLRVAKDRKDRYTQAVIHWMTADIHERRGDPAAALAERDAELVLLATIGNQRNTAVAHAAKARLLAELGREHDAAAAATSARTAAEKVNDEAFSAAIDQQLRALSPSHY